MVLSPSLLIALLFQILWQLWEGLSSKFENLLEVGSPVVPHILEHVLRRLDVNVMQIRRRLGFLRWHFILSSLIGVFTLPVLLNHPPPNVPQIPVHLAVLQLDSYLELLFLLDERGPFLLQVL